MDNQTLETIVQDIVATTAAMLKTHLPHVGGRLSYCAVFTRDNDELESLRRQVPTDAILANDTPTGPVYVLSHPVATASGPLRIVKLRNPDASRTERGDADYAIEDYEHFRTQVADQPGYSLIVREKFEMIEFADPAYSARIYFSHPPVEEHDGIREALRQFD